MSKLSKEEIIKNIKESLSNNSVKLEDLSRVEKNLLNLTVATLSETNRELVFERNPIELLKIPYENMGINELKEQINNFFKKDLIQIATEKKETLIEILVAQDEVMKLDIYNMDKFIKEYELAQKNKVLVLDVAFNKDKEIIQRSFSISTGCDFKETLRKNIGEDASSVQLSETIKDEIIAEVSVRKIEEEAGVSENTLLETEVKENEIKIFDNLQDKWLYEIEEYVQEIESTGIKGEDTFALYYMLEPSIFSVILPGISETASILALIYPERKVTEAIMYFIDKIKKVVLEKNCKGAMIPDNDVIKEIENYYLKYEDIAKEINAIEEEKAKKAIEREKKYNAMAKKTPKKANEKNSVKATSEIIANVAGEGEKEKNIVQMSLF